MKPLSSSRQNTVNNYYNTSTHRIHIYRGTKPRRCPTFPGHFVSPGPNNTLVTTAYRKPIHTDQYLHGGRNHFITVKNIVFNILAFTGCTSQQAIQKEMEHIRKALQACNFPPWACNNLQNKSNHKLNIHNGQTTISNEPSTNNNGSNSKNTSMVVYHTYTD